MRIGLIAEDLRDCVSYEELIKKIRNDIETVVPIPCHGVANLKKVFVNYLKLFEYNSEPVHKVIVVRDSDCIDAVQREQELQGIFQNSHFQPSFHVHFYATKCELETWLMADEAAVNAVAQLRGKTGRARPVDVEFENYKPAKELFVRMLSEARLPDDPTVYRQIAAAMDIQKVAGKCPRFNQFVNAVNAC